MRHRSAQAWESDLGRRPGQIPGWQHGILDARLMPMTEGQPRLGVREPTARLLWEACRRRTDPDAIERAITAGADAAAAAVAAVDHRVGPLLWRALQAAGAADALGDARSWLGAIAEVHHMEAQLLLPRAVSLALRPLTDAGLEPVVLKGPVVAARYPQPGLRPMDDIDLLLPRDQHVRALSLLGDAGWQVARPARRDLYDTMLTHADLPSLALELHYALETSVHRVNSLDALALWERRQPVECMGARAFALPLPEELVVLAAHAGKPHHNFSRLVWIADLAMLVGHATETGAGADWEAVRATADAGDCATVVAVALESARHAGVDAPRALFPMPPARRRARILRRVTDASWPLDTSGTTGTQLQYALTDDRWLRARILVVLLGSGYGIGRRMRRSVAAPRRALARARDRWVPARRPSTPSAPE
jgi:hypothetical protein